MKNQEGSPQRRRDRREEWPELRIGDKLGDRDARRLRGLQNHPGFGFLGVLCASAVILNCSG
jgi:hypothetical protein